MNDARNQQEAVKPQQELRFTARDPVLDEALASFENYGKTHSAYLPKNLYLFAMKRISIDMSDRLDGQSLNESAFLQYRMAVENVGNNGKREFPLEPWVKPLHAGGPSGALVGVGLRVRFNPQYSDMILAPPLLGKRLYPDMPDDKRIEAERSNKVFVTQLRIVTAYPRSAREKDLYPYENPIERTFEHVDGYLTAHPEVLPSEPIYLSSHIENVS